ncbi:uncharacterized protein [Blastocystis hominis]|uniref:Uncharacterized protein n=1 Tax=Blastocystis hominis TaxID=12968 RepID=D8LX62_BLAHO|nr:uncharacterized protein [Blastocystis hominis]CBK20857.2 unnamed protein product [Blastocystis hominis]|eukprot:XP_012894905.1 uncharacterized protein [Blastocystis hominis]
MCRKVKTSDHFINPNSDTLFHVCDNCRYLRKTKYKKKRVRVELERPSSGLSRNRDSNGLRSTRNSSMSGRNFPSSARQIPVKEEIGGKLSPKKLAFTSVVPSRNWVEISDENHPNYVPKNRKVCIFTDAQYAVNHPYYRYQEVIYNNDEESVTVLHSSIPPTPQSLIFCCKTSAYGNRFAFYDRLWMNQS